MDKAMAVDTHTSNTRALVETRQQRARARACATSLPAAVFSNRDIVRLLLPMLSSRTFVALRCASTEIRTTTQQARCAIPFVLARKPRSPFEFMGSTYL